jgi:hypothetical protein
MARFKLTRNVEAADKELFQVKLPKPLIADVNLMTSWAKRDRTDVVAEMLRYALAQESEFQRYKKSASAGSDAGPAAASAKKVSVSEKTSSAALAAAK